MGCGTSKSITLRKYTATPSVEEHDAGSPLAQPDSGSTACEMQLARVRGFACSEPAAPATRSCRDESRTVDAAAGTAATDCINTTEMACPVDADAAVVPVTLSSVGTGPFEAATVLVSESLPAPAVQESGAHTAKAVYSERSELACSSAFSRQSSETIPPIVKRPNLSAVAHTQASELVEKVRLPRRGWARTRA
jgi:hypothetical protein